jgi:hypothetical protein
MLACDSSIARTILHRTKLCLAGRGGAKKM